MFSGRRSATGLVLAAALGLIASSLIAPPALATHTDPTAGHGTWVDAPDPPGRQHHAAATTVFGTVVMTGGDPDDDSDFEPTTDTFYLGPGASSWTTGISLPAPRLGHAMALDSSGGVYAIGGSDASGFAATVYHLTFPVGGTWTSVAPLPVALGEAAAATDSDGRVWVVGGNRSNNGFCCVTENRLFVYTPSTNTWAEKASMPTRRFGLGATFGGDGKLYAIGGRLSVGSLTTTNKVEAYNPGTNTWSTVAPDPYSTLLPGVTAGPDGLVYAVGGLDQNTSPATVQNATRVYNPATNSWALLPILSSPRHGAAFTTGNSGEMYAISGETVSGGLAAVTPATDALFVAANQLSATSHSFGNTAVDGAKTFTVTISRKLSVALQVDGYDFVGTDANDFSVSSETCIGKPVSDPSCTVTVRFVPTSLGSKQATLLVRDVSNDAPHRVAVSGTGVASGIRIDPQMVDALVGEAKTFTTTYTSATGRSLADATSATAFTITPDGTCSANVCKAGLPGTHQISAFVSPFSAHTTLEASEPPPGGGPNPSPNPGPPAGPTGQRAAALAKCKKKHSKKARRKCRKRAKLLPASARPFPRSILG